MVSFLINDIFSNSNGGILTKFLEINLVNVVIFSQIDTN